MSPQLLVVADILLLCSCSRDTTDRNKIDPMGACRANECCEGAKSSVPGRRGRVIALVKKKQMPICIHQVVGENLLLKGGETIIPTTILGVGVKVNTNSSGAIRRANTQLIAK